MQVSHVLTFLQAAHLSYLVKSPWEERGGIFVVAPPGAFKTTLINYMSEFSEALCLGDINVKSLVALRDDIMGGRYHTLAFGEMEKLYARNPATASNIEAHLRQFVEEGLRQASFEDARMVCPPARCLVIAGMTNALYGRKMQEWNANGFLRRFIICSWLLSDENAIVNAIHNWQKIQFHIPIMFDGKRTRINYNLDERESRWLSKLLNDQVGVSTPFVLMKKTACVLKHHLPDTWKDVVSGFSEGMKKGGALLELTGTAMGAKAK